MEKNIKSILELKKLVFKRITFERESMSSDESFRFQLKSEISQKKDEDLYRVELSLLGEKEHEYRIEICLYGFFTFDVSERIPDELKDDLLSKNAVAIMMPYIRSELSIITAQPEVECIVLPPFNINELLGSSNKS